MPVEISVQRLDESSSFSEDLRLLRAIDPDLRCSSKAEIRALLETLDEQERLEAIRGIEAAQELAKHALAPLIARAHALRTVQEVERSPKEGELQKIDLSDCLVLTKISKRDWDMRAANCSEEELIKLYREQGLDEGRIQRILNSHVQQQISLKLVEQQFKDAGLDEQRVFVLSELTPERAKELVNKFPCIIALGGDDHAKAVSHLISGDKYFCAVNSDVGSSVGGLTAFSRDDMPELIRNLASGDFLIQEWPRLEVEVERGSDRSVQSYPPSLSEVILTEEKSLYTLRASFNAPELYDTEKRDALLIHSKGSGVIVATGAGSTGWFSSAIKIINPDGRKFPRTAKRMEFVTREPYGDPVREEQLTGAYYEGEVMGMHVNSKHQPIVSGDSVWVQPVTEGDEVRVRLSKEPLKVITGFRHRMN
jgi:NAD kinase